MEASWLNLQRDWDGSIDAADRQGGLRWTLSGIGGERAQSVSTLVQGGSCFLRWVFCVVRCGGYGTCFWRDRWYSAKDDEVKWLVPWSSSAFDAH